MFYRNFNKNKGFALSEVLLAIAVIIIIGISAYGLYSSARTTATVEQAVNDAKEIQINVSKMGLDKNNALVALRGEVLLANMGLMPDDLEYDPGFLGMSWYQNKDGVFFQVTSSGSGSVPNWSQGGVTLSIRNLPSTTYCVKLATALAPSYAGVGSNPNDDSIKGATTTNSIDVNALNAACQKHSFGASNGIDGLWFTNL